MSECRKFVVDFESYFELPDINFRCVGLNPSFEKKRKTPKLQQLANFVLFQTVFWTLTVTTFFEIMYCFDAWETNNLMDICRCIPCALFHIMGIEQMILVWFRGNKFNDFILQLEEMFPKNTKAQEKYFVRNHVEETQKVLRALTKIFVMCIFIWCVGSPIYEGIICYPYSFDLLFHIWFPFDLNKQFWFYFALYLEMGTIYASVMIILAVNAFFISILSQIGLQYKMLAQNIRELAPNDHQGLRKLVALHIRIIEISRQFARLLSRTVFFIHLISSIGICCSLYLIIDAELIEKFRYTTFVACVLIQTFNISFIGDQLIEHSLSIGDAIYDNHWLDGDKEFRLTMLQILIRSQTPLALTGLNFFSISLPSCTKILMTSFSYFALLRSILEN